MTQTNRRWRMYAIFVLFINLAIISLGSSCQVVVAYCISYDFSDCNPELNIWNGAQVRMITKETRYHPSFPEDEVVYVRAQQAPLAALRQRFVRAYIPAARGDCEGGIVYVGPVEYSFEELFECKHGRKPTAAELESITEEQATQLLNECKGISIDCPGGEYTLEAEPILPTFREQHFQPLLPCLGSVNTNKIFQIGGKVIFPDGTECELEERYETPMIFKQNTTINVVMKLREDCPLCS